MRYALVVLAFVALPNSAVAFPISPQTIWELTQSADRIVLARVDSVGRAASTVKRGNGDEYPERARLEVIETWKGQHEPKLEVSFDSSYVCPAPERYLPGKRVVAFLYREKSQWVTVALSYGTRYPVGEAAEAEYRRSVQLAVKEQQTLSPPKQGERPPRASRSWALASIEGRATRWDGLYALSSETDPTHAYYDQSRNQQIAISDEILAQVEAAFVRAPSYDSTLPQMLRLLKSRKSVAVTQAASDAIETALSGASTSYCMPEAIDLLAERLENKKAEPPINLETQAGSLDERVAAEAKLAARTPLKRSTVEREESDQRVWAALKQRHKLQPRIRSDFQRELPTATGGDTSL
jgi:hypothetical protein